MASNAATITMSMREADRLKTVQAVMDRMLRVGQAAQRLGLSRRQLERLIQRYTGAERRSPQSIAADSRTTCRSQRCAPPR